MFAFSNRRCSTIPILAWPASLAEAGGTVGVEVLAQGLHPQAGRQRSQEEDRQRYHTDGVDLARGEDVLLRRRVPPVLVRFAHDGSYLSDSSR